eukprot:Opistho-2@23434
MGMVERGRKEVGKGVGETRRSAYCGPPQNPESGVPASPCRLWHTAGLPSRFAEKGHLPMASEFVFAPPATVSVPVAGQPARFPVHRIYCVGRNYEDHAKEMGFTGREPPFFFMKPADALVTVDAGQTGTMAYPTLTKNLHHEIELVVAIGTSGKNIKAADAHKHIYGYAVGLDMTRR